MPVQVFQFHSVRKYMKMLPLLLHAPQETISLSTHCCTILMSTKTAPFTGRYINFVCPISMLKFFNT